MLKKIPEKSFYPIYGYMLEELKLGGSELLVYAILNAFSRGNSSYYGSQEYLSRLSGLSISTVKRALNSLLDKNLIERKIIDGFLTYRIIKPKKDTTSLESELEVQAKNLAKIRKKEIPSPTVVELRHETLADHLPQKGRPMHEFYDITDNGIIQMTPEQYFFLVNLVGEDKLLDYIERIENKVLSGEYHCHPDYKFIKKWILEDVSV